MAAVLSQFTLWIDRTSGAPLLNSIFFYTGSADGARSILSSIASSMIGVGGVVFSMTLVTLSLAAQQFGSRTLRSLVRDRGNQAVLGMFVSAFLFCLLILRQVRTGGNGESDFVPQISMLVALLFALGGIGLLIHFIHHISFVIQAPHVISEAGRELASLVRQRNEGNWSLFYDADEIRKWRAGESLSVLSEESGYLRRVDYCSLADRVAGMQVMAMTEKRPGDFVFAGECLLKIFSAQKISEEPARALQADILETYSFGPQRTEEQDVRYLLGQIIDIALLALSPGINNPNQAILCLDRLSDAMRIEGLRKPRGTYFLGEKAQLAIVDAELSFDELFDYSFHEIMLNLKTQHRVSCYLLEHFRRLFALLPAESKKEKIASAYAELFQQTIASFPEKLVGISAHLYS